MSDPAPADEASPPDRFDRYLALVPRGLEHIVSDIVKENLKEYVVRTLFVGENDKYHNNDNAFREHLEHQKPDRKKRRKSSTEGTCKSAVGSLVVDSNKHVSIGYWGEKCIWTQPGRLQGTIWLELRTDAPVETVANLRCLGPLVALVDVFDHVDLDEGRSLQEAAHEIDRSVVGEKEFLNHFQVAFSLWRKHVKAVWPSPQGKTIHDKGTSIKYRLSCMRTDSKRYKYSRQQFISSGVVESVVAAHHDWSVDLTNFDLEVVLLQRPHCFVVGFALRSYQLVAAGSFESGVLPPDVSSPYISPSSLSTTRLVRLRPTTAHVLLHLAQIRPGDVVLDPTAGIGTIPIEASMLEAHGIGGDVALVESDLFELTVDYSRKARKEQQKQGGGGGGTADMMLWDAGHVPLRSQSVDAVISDLPFGQRCMSSNTLDGFLPVLLDEMARLLRLDTGRMVLLCGSYVAVLEALKEANNRAQNIWQVPCSSVFPVTIGGHVAWIVHVQRGSDDAVPLPTFHERVKKMTGRRERQNRRKIPAKNKSIVV